MEKLEFHWYIYGRCKIDIGSPIEPLKIGSCLGPALSAEVAAQALSAYHVVPALSTIVMPRVVLWPCFLVWCLMPLIVPGPFGILYCRGTARADIDKKGHC
jgi:hypothetical protein